MKASRTPPAIAGTIAMLLAAAFQTACRPATATPEEARTIAKEAYTYGYPMVDGYRIL